MILMRSELNLLLTGELLAHTRGVDVKKVIWITFFLSSLLIGVIVSVCGPIGFVGMMAPHICRLVVGWNHRVLIPATFVFGGVFLIWCDVASRMVLAPQEIPVGIITAMLGGPFFIWLLSFRTREVEGAA
jgi:iron complex transport system permease protein